MEQLDRNDAGVSTSSGGNKNMRERLMDVAERLFAQNGVAETSVRALTAEAELNIASVNYYFGSKEALFRQVIARRLTALNDERLQLLEQLWPTSPHPLAEDVLYALVAPSMELCYKFPYFARLASRLRASQSELWSDYRAHQAAITQHFQEAFEAALPDLPSNEVNVRLHFVLGAIHHVWSQAPLPETQPLAQTLGSFLTFYGAGLHAPSSFPLKLS